MAFMGGKAKRKVVISGMLGNGLEWYDYALYGHMSIVFSKLFFPEGDLSKNLILTFLIFAAGFISRPLGAILFGRIGDKYGRKKALTTSMILMAIPTGCIGLLPTYEMVGVIAPVLLLFIRILQGLSLGGAYSGSISYVVEHAPPEQRSTVGSVIKLSLVLGFLVGSIVSTIVASVLSVEDFYQWGWRLPFFLGVGIGFVGFYIRNHGEESPVYEQAKKDGSLSKSPVKDAFMKHPLSMLQAFSSYLFVTVPFYVIAIYMIAYSKNQLGLSEDDALLINSLAMASMLITIFPAARMADRIGRKKVLMAAIVTMLVVVAPLFNLMQSGLFMDALIAQVVIAMIIGWYLGPMPAVLVEMFPTSVRYTGMSMAYNLCAILGGLTPSIAEWMIRGTGDNSSIMWLIIGAGIASFITMATYKDDWRAPLRA